MGLGRFGLLVENLSMCERTGSQRSAPRGDRATSGRSGSQMERTDQARLLQSPRMVPPATLRVTGSNTTILRRADPGHSLECSLVRLIS